MTYRATTIHVDNVNEALPIALHMLKQHGNIVSSRGLETVEAPGPVSTVYSSPWRRVLFDIDRDANPFFHLIDALWLLSGSCKAALPCHFLNGLRRFSDDGHTFHGAYGHRLRNYREGRVDQLDCVIALLQDKPDTRQAVLSIWDPMLDLGAPTKDMPCNDMVMLRILDGNLHMTVCNRSNDAILGAYGANVVQFSILQEWLAAAIGVNVGSYVQQSNSFHVYTDNTFWGKFLAGQYAAGHVWNAYSQPASVADELYHYPIACNAIEAKLVQEDCELLARLAEDGASLTGKDLYASPFFDRVVTPMINGYHAWKIDGDKHKADDLLRYVAAPDWCMAMRMWVSRRGAAA